MSNFFLIDELFSDGCQGAKIIFLLRLVMLPFAITSYLLGVTSAKFWQFAVGSTSYVVKLAIHVYIGCSVYRIELMKAHGIKASQDNILLFVEVIIVFSCTIIASIYARNILDKKIKDNAEMNAIANNLDFNPFEQIQRSKTFMNEREQRPSFSKYNPNALRLARKSQTNLNGGENNEHI